MEFSNFFLLLIAINSICKINPCYAVSTTDTGIRFNKLVKDGENTMPVGPRTYLELIKSGTFVDKSSFIYDVLLGVEDRALAISYPPKWGKSINLDMLKTFLEIRVDENGTRIPISENQNYRLFCEGKYDENGIKVELNQPLVISNRDNYRVFDEYLGNYPVVYLSFENSPGSYGSKNYTGLIKKTIADAFEMHRYMINVYKNAGEIVTYKANKFFEYLTEKTDDFTQSVNFLCHQLHDHFKRKVFILVDNYDTILKIKSIDGNFFLDFLDLALNRNEYVSKCIITSTYPVVMYHDFLTFNDFLTCFNFYSWYGYSQSEMELLYRHFNINSKEHQDTVKKWYGGYVTSGNKTNQFFHPWSVNSYMNKRKTSDYWISTTDYVALLKRSFVGPLRSTLQELVNERGVEGTVYDFVFDIHELESLHGSNTTDEFRNFVFKSLFVSGYLTIDDVRNCSGEYYVTYVIPNEEIRTGFRKAYEIIVN